MQKSPIQLGPIDLQDFEIPQSVRFGGRHRVTVHALADGRRVVERLGPDDNEIQFRGTFSGPTAEERARAFDILRLSGEIVWLTWESFRRQVIVNSFIADYYSPWWIPYQVTCIVVHQTRIASSQETSVAAMLAADLSSAMSAAAGTTISLAPLQAAVSTTNALASGTKDQALAIAAVASTLNVINSQMTQLANTLVTPIPPGADPAETGQAFASIVNCAGSMAAAVNVSSYVGRIGANISGSTN